MGFSCGIVGLPNAGKSTLFNALTKGTASVGAYPFTTVEPNIAVVPVPDPRLDVIARLSRSARSVPTVIRFVDIAGLVEGASRGEGLGNRFLGHIREVEAIVHVVRCFDDESVAHVQARLDPARDAGAINTEIALADLEAIERRRQRIEGAVKARVPKALEEYSFLSKIEHHLNEGSPVRTLDINDGEAAILKHLSLLTAKPVIYVGNVSEENAAAPGDNPNFAKLVRLAQREETPCVAVSAKIEAEILELAEEDAKAFLEDLGLEETGAISLVHECYRLLNLVTFFTANAKEARAWTVPEGTRAPVAAGKVHSDMQAGFICAEVLAWEDAARLSLYNEAKEAGRIRLEGKDYRIRDGDLVLFRFSS